MVDTTLRRSVGLLFFLAVVVHGIYFFRTNPQLRVYDAVGHVDYVAYILDNGRLPLSNECWECYHPPLYYLTAAALIKVFRISPKAGGRFLQGYSLFLFLTLLILGLKIFEIVLPDASPRLLASAFFLLWPAGFIHGVRIGNDSLLYVFEAASLLMLLRWNSTDSPKAFLLSAFWGAMALFTKANGLLSLITIGIVFFWRERTRLASSFAKYRTGLFCAALGILSFLYTFWIKGAVTTNIHGLPQIYFVKDSLWSFFGFGWRSYLNFPFTVTWNDQGGRRYVWNFFLKTCLFGEYASECPFVRALAPVVSAMFLGIVGVGGIGFVRSWKDSSRRVLAVYATVSLLGALSYRLASHSPGAIDFRYIYPTIIAWAVFFVAGAAELGKSKSKWVQAVPTVYLGIFLTLTTGMILFF